MLNEVLLDLHMKNNRNMYGIRTEGSQQGKGVHIVNIKGPEKAQNISRTSTLRLFLKIYSKPIILVI